MPQKPPSILFLNQHYYPDHAATGQYLTDLAEYLVEDGFDVSVLCSRGHYVEGSHDHPLRETRNGVKIYRIPSAGLGRSSHVRRLLDYITFIVPAFFFLLFRRRYDTLISLTTPPMLSVAPCILKGIKRQRYGIWSMDLHPDAEEAIGMLNPDSRSARLLHRMNDFGYRHADFVVSLGAYMRDRILKKGIDETHLHTIPVWSKKCELQPIARASNPLRDKLGLREKFVVMYSGNAGHAHRFDEVLFAMQRLRDHPEIYFLFVGNGPQRELIEDHARVHRVKNFQYLDYFSRDELRHSLSLADVHIMSLRTAMVGIAVPSKIIGALAVGRPVLMVGPVESEPGKLITSESVGLVIEPNGSVEMQGKELVHAIERLHADASEVESMGTRARSVFLEQYEHDYLCRKWSEVLRSVL